MLVSWKDGSNEGGLILRAESIEKELQTFQAAIKNLSTDISNASCLWSDEKFSQLSASIGVIANQSKDVLVAGERCCASIAKLNKIIEEKY